MSAGQIIFDIVIGALALYSVIMGTINSILIQRRNEELQRYWHERKGTQP